MRRIFVWLHRYVGLALAGFLIVEGLTGSIIAFKADLTGFLDPRLVATRPAPDARRLSLAEAALRAEELEPTEHVDYFVNYGDDRITMRMGGRRNPATGERYPDVPFFVSLNPWTGERLAAVEPEGLWARFLAAVIPFVYELHVNLLAGPVGQLILFAVALLWTIDCFVGFYLTLPITLQRFWPRWTPAWLVKWRGGFYRVNFDLHRAGGLWFWAALFVFAWSSVQLTNPIVYDWVMTKLSDSQGVMEATMRVYRFPTSEEDIARMKARRNLDEPFGLGWREAQATGERLMAAEAAREGFKILRPAMLNRVGLSRLYSYDVVIDRPFPQRRSWQVFFDADTGALHAAGDPIRLFGLERWGDTFSDWIRQLHLIQDPIDYFSYRIFVAIAGVVVAMLSITGIYVWWKKRRARAFSRAQSVGRASPRDGASVRAGVRA